MNGIASKLEHRAFTLVELLVVIAIIGILMALILPAVQSSRESGRKASCQNNIRQLQTGMVHYEQSKGTYPPGRLRCDGMTKDACAGVPSSLRYGVNGFVLILPQLEETALFQNARLDNTFWPQETGNATPGNSASWSPGNLQLIRYRMPLMICPSNQAEPTYRPDQASLQDDLNSAIGSYAMVAGTVGPSQNIDEITVKLRNTGAFNYVYALKAAQVRDGLSKTIFLGEVSAGHKAESANRWSFALRHSDTLRNTENALNTPPATGSVLDLYGYKTNGAFSSDHTGGGFFAFGDTHTTFFSDEIDLTAYRALSTRAGGEETKEVY